MRRVKPRDLIEIQNSNWIDGNLFGYVFRLKLPPYAGRLGVHLNTGWNVALRYCRPYKIITNPKEYTNARWLKFHKYKPPFQQIRGFEINPIAVAYADLKEKGYCMKCYLKPCKCKKVKK